jgi:CheY-like chemotaxis protein
MSGGIKPAKHSGVSFLVVDNEPGVSRTIKLMLKMDRHKVETADSGDAALAWLEQRDFDLIITDYSMPGMTGDRLAALIRQRRPAQPIIMVTGSIDVFNTYGKPPDAVNLILHQPFTRTQLREAMSQILS